MISRFFIDRPIFAWVIALVIMLAGGLSVANLPIEQYPNIALPTVSVNANYPAATAQTVEDSVTQVIEQGMTGIDHLKYISSTSSNGGGSNVTLTFDAGTDVNFAQIQVQNAMQSVQRRLPQEVQAQGVNVSKSQSNPLIVFALLSKDGTLSNYDLGDYLATHIQDPLSRIDGVGSTNINGSPYAMRIWLDPNKLAGFNLTVADVTRAIQAQNTQVSAGEIGGEPNNGDISLNATITAQSRLTTADQFANIVVKTAATGNPVFMKDVARVELGAQSYGAIAKLNGYPAAGIQVRLATGANALKTAEAAKALIEELAKDFPPGISYEIPNDSTQFVKLSIEEVVKTLIEAVALVFIVMFIFLQNWRATLIPTIAVPVVLLGTFGVLAVFGFSINTLTLFGLVLAIGLLVDDAIVVVENVERVMHEEGLSPLEATRRSMDEITGALIGVAAVLAAMFVPMAFFGGTQGVIYRQFSITLVSAMTLSVLVAIVLTPPLCATLLKAPKHGHNPNKGFFGLFNRGFDATTNRYQKSVSKLIRQPLRWIIVYGAILASLGYLFLTLPTAFLPEEDQGAVQTIVQLPVGSTTSDTRKVLDQIQAHYQKDPAVRVVFTIAGGGGGGGGGGQNLGTVFARLKPFEQRKTDDLSVSAVVDRARKAFAKIKNATVIPTVPPVVRELGSATGFQLVLRDSGGLGHDALMAARKQMIADASQSPLLTGVRASGQEDTPQLKIDIDNGRAGAFGVSLADANSTMSTALGGSYINDFIDRGRVKRVYVQADAPFRMRPDDLNLWQVRNASGQMVPFGAFGSTRWVYGSPQLERFDGLSSAQIQGAPADGISSGVAMKAVEEIAQTLPQGITYQWTGLSLQERESGNQAPALYGLSLLVVFLLLAALYESWSIPFSVILVVPLGIFGALMATYLRGMNNDIYFQVGLLTTMGLSAKNAILIVEFAKALYDGSLGRPAMGLFEATVEAVRIRLRPIIMTSLAFTFGIMPLVTAHGVGSGAQKAIGTGLLGGVIAATVLAIFFVPLFFVIVQSLFGGRRPETPPETPIQTPSGEASA